MKILFLFLLVTSILLASRRAAAKPAAQRLPAD
jgi:hypothetical protein